MIPRYGPEVLSRYNAFSPDLLAQPPHVYMVSARAYAGMHKDAQGQAVLISGESGAGKTEATKKVLSYLSSAAGSAPDAAGVDEQIISTNPILEAFGNAKTVRNNNSSRFGKFMRVQFSKDGRHRVLGCRVRFDSMPTPKSPARSSARAHTRTHAHKYRLKSFS